jgi:hypothetical protein
MLKIKFKVIKKIQDPQVYISNLVGDALRHISNEIEKSDETEYIIDFPYTGEVMIDFATDEYAIRGHEVIPVDKEFRNNNDRAITNFKEERLRAKAEIVKLEQELQQLSKEQAENKLKISEERAKKAKVKQADITKLENEGEDIERFYAETFSRIGVLKKKVEELTNNIETYENTRIIRFLDHKEFKILAKAYHAAEAISVLVNKVKLACEAHKEIEEELLQLIAKQELEVKEVSRLNNPTLQQEMERRHNEEFRKLNGKLYSEPDDVGIEKGSRLDILEEIKELEREIGVYKSKFISPALKIPSQSPIFGLQNIQKIASELDQLMRQYNQNPANRQNILGQLITLQLLFTNFLNFSTAFEQSLQEFIPIDPPEEYMLISFKYMRNKEQQLQANLSALNKPSTRTFKEIVEAYGLNPRNTQVFKIEYCPNHLHSYEVVPSLEFIQKHNPDFFKVDNPSMLIRDGTKLIPKFKDVDIKSRSRSIGLTENEIRFLAKLEEDRDKNKEFRIAHAILSHMLDAVVARDSATTDSERIQNEKKRLCFKAFLTRFLSTL